ncbi:uncharacterized protein LOC128239918 [Mya arenaria]|uniref:uncharacterized protein LOC128239918 n=1 Tax=Mya arenaria TaxID=6604 RepID=UPI0022E850D3|nr:uncharacterized protein LOC128239918 [Mya arenaria]
MDAIKVFCFVFVLVGVLAGVSEAIKCYNCTSLTAGNCKDDFKKEGITIKDNCSACMKTKGKYEGNQVVMRTCSPIKVGKNECKEITQLGAKMNVCTCVNDLCNGTPRVTVTVFTLVTAVLAAFKMV